jgi:hypothetical protein
VGVLTLGVLALGGCGLPSDEAYRPIDRDALGALAETTTSSTTTTTSTTLPPATTTTVQPTTTTAPRTEAIDVYFVDGNQMLTPVRRDATLPVTAEKARTLLQEGLRPTDPAGLRSSIPPGALLGVNIAGGKALVSLAPAALEPTGREQVLQFGQIVMTLTGLRGVGQVEFQLTNPDGTVTPLAVPTATFAPDNSPSADDYRSIVAPRSS